MFVYNENSARKVLTPWGKEVRKRLIDRNMMQMDLVKILKDKGFNVHKATISHLIYGIGVSARTEEIKVINSVLGIE